GGCASCANKHRTATRPFHNRGDGTSEEVTAETGAGVLGDRPRAGMGAAVGDPFGDGRESLFVTNFGAEPNSLYRNVKGALFEDAGAASGAGPVGIPFVRWGTGFADFDNDGWPDVYAAGGHLAPRMVRLLGHSKSGYAAYVDGGDKPFPRRTVLLHNRGAGRCGGGKDAGDLAPLRMSARGTAVADLDGDGGLDLVIVDLDGPVRVLKNTAADGRGWVEIQPL